MESESKPKFTEGLESAEVEEGSNDDSFSDLSDTELQELSKLPDSILDCDFPDSFIKHSEGSLKAPLSDENVLSTNQQHNLSCTEQQQEFNDVPEWADMNSSEKNTYMFFCQAGLPREEATNRINELRQERGIPRLSKQTVETKTTEEHLKSNKDRQAATENDKTRVEVSEASGLSLNVECVSVPLTADYERSCNIAEDKQEFGDLPSNQEGRSNWASSTRAASTQAGSTDLRNQWPCSTGKKLSKTQKKTRAKLLKIISEEKMKVYNSWRELGLTHQDAFDKVLDLPSQNTRKPVVGINEFQRDRGLLELSEQHGGTEATEISKRLEILTETNNAPFKTIRKGEVKNKTPYASLSSPADGVKTENVDEDSQPKLDEGKRTIGYLPNDRECVILNRPEEVRHPDCNYSEKELKEMARQLKTQNLRSRFLLHTCGRDVDPTERLKYFLSMEASNQKATIRKQSKILPKNLQAKFCSMVMQGRDPAKLMSQFLQSAENQQRLCKKLQLSDNTLLLKRFQQPGEQVEGNIPVSQSLTDWYSIFLQDGCENLAIDKVKKLILHGAVAEDNDRCRACSPYGDSEPFDQSPDEANSTNADPSNNDFIEHKCGQDIASKTPRTNSGRSTTKRYEHGKADRNVSASGESSGYLRTGYLPPRNTSTKSEKSGAALPSEVLDKPLSPFLHSQKASPSYHLSDDEPAFRSPGEEISINMKSRKNVFQEPMSRYHSEWEPEAESKMPGAKSLRRPNSDASRRVGGNAFASKYSSGPHRTRHSPPPARNTSIYYGKSVDSPPIQIWQPQTACSPGPKPSPFNQSSLGRISLRSDLHTVRSQNLNKPLLPTPTSKKASSGPLEVGSNPSWQVGANKKRSPFLPGSNRSRFHQSVIQRSAPSFNMGDQGSASLTPGTMSSNPHYSPRSSFDTSRIRNDLFGPRQCGPQDTSVMPSVTSPGSSCDLKRRNVHTDPSMYKRNRFSDELSVSQHKAGANHLNISGHQRLNNSLPEMHNLNSVGVLHPRSPIPEYRTSIGRRTINVPSQSTHPYRSPFGETVTPIRTNTGPPGVRDRFTRSVGSSRPPTRYDSSPDEQFRRFREKYGHSNPDDDATNHW